MSDSTIFSMNVLVKTSPNRAEIQKRELEAEDLGNYIVLREFLSLFEQRMVAYFFAGETAQERAKRALEIRGAIAALPNPLWAQTELQCQNDEDCPPGQRCVNGVCTQIPPDYEVQETPTVSEQEQIIS